MSCSRRLGFPSVIAIVATIGMAGVRSHAQENSYHLVEGWAQLPDHMNGGKWGQVSAVGTDAEGNVYVLHKCFTNTCADRSEAPILKFDPSGTLLKGFGAGQIPSPHGFHVDRNGFIWATDTPVGTSGPGIAGKGQQVFKFSPDGQVLMTLGTAGVVGEGPNTFNGPADVAIAANGDIFVADGHVNNRVVKFSKDGRFIKAWGKTGAGPGEFKVPHTIAIDSRGRVFVGDRGNNRIQVFDEDGRFLEEWKQFGRPSGIFIASDDTVYVADADSSAGNNPGFKRGIRIGSAKDGIVKVLIEDPLPDPGSGAEGVTADAKGNIYVAMVRKEDLRKYVRK